MKKYTRRIYIDNSGFKNRGDQLMIQAVCEQLSEHYPDAQILIKKSAFLQNPTYCIEHRIYPLETSKNFIKRSWLYKKVCNVLLRDDWMVSANDIDVILDCRGYHLADWRISDQDYVDYLKRYYSLFSKKGRRLIMLPQAFGPFENPYSQQAMRLVYDQANVIFARERISYNYLIDMFSESSKIEIAPDFTCMTKQTENLPLHLSPRTYVLLVPNAKMIEQGSAESESAYIDYLITIAKYLKDKGENVYLLNHEGAEDEKILIKVNAGMGNVLPLLSNLSGSSIKAIIKGAKLLISGRYHGVVSGLTQNVPTLCTGWSHKYAELMEEHQCEGNILQVDDIQTSLKVINDALENPEQYSSKQGCNSRMKSQVGEMWEKVYKIIEA